MGWYKHPLLILFLISLGLRSVATLPQPHPLSLDEAYNYVNGLTLLQGGGLQANFLWNYLHPPASLPQPSHLYWMPLSSFIAAAAMAIMGVGHGQAQLGFALIAALLPPFGYYMTGHVTQNRSQAWLVGWLLVFSGFYVPVWAAVDSFAPFALTGAVCLYALWQTIEKRSAGWAGLAGLAAGLSHLSRADGLLFLLLGGLVFTLELWRQKSISPGAGLRWLGVTLVMLGSGYLLVMGPWFWRNFVTIGAIQPPGGLQTIWLTSYNDLFRYAPLLSVQTYLDQGWMTILQQKIWAMGVNLQTLLAVQGLIVALPLAAVGGWHWRHHRLFQIAGLYILGLWLAMTFVFTFPGVRGALFHSGGATLPYIFLAAVIGLEHSVRWIAKHRPGWQPRRALPVFRLGLLGLAVLISGFAYAARLPAWQGAHPAYAEIARRLDNEAATVMVRNPPAYLYFGGHQAIVVPNEDLPTTLHIAERYQVHYLVIDANYPPRLADLFHQADADPHPELELLVRFNGPVYLYRLHPEP